jgi:hypothetical protein
VLSASPLLAALAAFLAGVAGGFSGFGISVVLVPLLLLVYDQPTVVALNGVLSAAIAAAVARDDTQFFACELRRIPVLGNLVNRDSWPPGLSVCTGFGLKRFWLE